MYRSVLTFGAEVAGVEAMIQTREDQVQELDMPK
jgi:hypothetical protein